MPVRTTETKVTFKHPFRLRSIDGLQPAGTYRLETDEEELQGLSFTAFRRTATLLHLPAISACAHAHEIVSIDPAELAAALEADGAA